MIIFVIFYNTIWLSSSMTGCRTKTVITQMLCMWLKSTWPIGEFILHYSNLWMFVMIVLLRILRLECKYKNNYQFWFWSNVVDILFMVIDKRPTNKNNDTWIIKNEINVRLYLPDRHVHLQLFHTLNIVDQLLMVIERKDQNTKP